ncbi:translocation/assembly module TamB domain-containing protein [uncultured Prevotellamassilia sp.]|uniref:translocation/assembly module TamB domain-containing protein n=1 Tax=uncultured Prevotellamassilia sp. TaxID=1926676 RepID=UPI0025902A99|nr:translocation/assembly module TamB domain-containing protein [uncultured Prevotellamassilia sp.]
MKKPIKKALKWLGITVATPIALFLLLAILLYIPPVQNFAVHQVANYLSGNLGMDVRIDKVRLAFPLDLAVHHMTAVEKGDTLLNADRLRLNVKLMPLFEGRADVDGFELYGLVIDTKSYISDTRIKGHAGQLTAAAHGVDWEKELVNLDHARLHDADIYVTLSDTAKKDTTESKAKWNIAVKKVDIERSKVHLQMPGDSMRIYANLGRAVLRGGAFDTGRNYYAVKALQLQDCDVNYDIPYIKPVAGIDPNHIAVKRLTLMLDTLSYNNEGVLRAGLRGLTLHEKCGLDVTRMSGSVYMDTTQLRLPALRLRTPASRIDADVAFDFKAFSAGKGGHCQAMVDASIGYDDIRTLATGYVDKAYLRALPHKPLAIKGTVSGNIDHLRLPSLTLNMPGVLQASANGYTNYVTKDWRNGKFNFNLRTKSMAAVRQLMPASLKQSINVPDGLSLRGKAAFNGNRYDADIKAGIGRGSLAAKAKLDVKRETYKVVATAHQLPIASIVRGVPVGPFSGSLRASGSGWDVMSPRASLTADAKVNALSYERYPLGGISLKANLRGGKAVAHFEADNPLLQGNGHIEALLGRHNYEVAVKASLPNLDLKKLGVTTDTLYFGTDIDIKATANKAFTAYALSGSIANNHFTTQRMSAMAKDILFDLATSRDTTTANISAGDLRLRLGAKGDIPHLGTHLARFANELQKEAKTYNIDQERLKTFLPVMAFYLDAGRDNPLYNIARMKGYSFSSAYVNLNTDPHVGMTGDARMGALNVGALLLDTIDTHIFQDSTGVQMRGMVKNGKKNPNPLEVRMRSYVMRSGAGIELSYYDSEGERGVDVGLQAALVDGGLNIHLYPENPVLAYRNFKVNKDNYIFLGKDNSIRADVDLLADDGTGLKIYGEPKDSVNDLTVSVNQVNLGELSAVLPYMPKLSGMLSGDVHVTDDSQHKQLSAMASLTADNFKYEDMPLGNVGIDAVYLPKTGGEHHASAFISSNGEEVLACNGTYFDRDGGTFEGDAQLHDFPLQMLNGFMAGTDVALKGIAGGDLRVNGSLDKLVINGSLDLDSAHIYSDVYGFDLRTDERTLDIKDSRIIFSDYRLFSTGKEPMVLNGTFDMSDFERMRMDFAMRANNFELINTRKKAQSMLFGKVYANYIGTLKGTTDNLSLRGKLEVLDRTDVTYILKDSPLSVDDRLHDLVQFTNFKDSTQRAQPEKAVDGGMDITMGISISDAAIFHCNLSDDGQSYVKLEGGGDMTLRMTQQGDMRMTGLFTTNSGEMKYQLPVIPLKTFQIVQGSYVQFTGDVMNPTLNIAAKERTKAVVTEDDKQRSVAFDVGVKITKPLNDMGLEFTIEAPEDLNIQNQLASMSAEQRGKAAVTMMATGMYMTDETIMSGSGFKANNALNAFLQSEIQNIAGSALKTIDINLGVESGTSQTGTSTTDYSFQFAKRFWGNRISVIIGGKVSTGADATNSAESFINNVSVEYRLDQGATRYVKAFYDRDTQDPLEGQLTKTGAGLVLRRKTDKLGELFIFRNKSKKKTAGKN